MTFVKICGITNREDALNAVEAGADALGFNFYPPSPRFIPASLARNIIDELPASVLTVGVFVNEATPADVMRVASEAGVTAVQLHGDEKPDYCAALSDWYVIKALTVGPEFDVETVTDYPVKALMLDGFAKQLHGGTGSTFDWTIAREVEQLIPQLFLAGGLSPENIVEAITTVRPYAVDACSLLELAPGKKDFKRVASFIQRAQSV